MGFIASKAYSEWARHQIGSNTDNIGDGTDEYAKADPPEKCIHDSSFLKVKLIF